LVEEVRSASDVKVTDTGDTVTLHHRGHTLKGKENTRMVSASKWSKLTL